MKLSSTQRIVINLRNGTGAASILGQLVQFYPVVSDDLWYQAVEADSANAIGVVAADGVPAEGWVPIVVRGLAYVKFANDQTPQLGTFATVDTDQDGLAGYPNALAYGQGIGMVVKSPETPLALMSVKFSRAKDVLG